MLPHEGNTDWIEETVLAAKRLLDQDKAPERDPGCPYCSFGAAIKKHANIGTKYSMKRRSKKDRSRIHPFD
jgi:hypothetical protein